MAEHTNQDFRIRAIAAPVREQLVQTLKQALYSQRFRPGQRLPERELCELTGASRTAMREALRQLESEGLINIIPHRGPSVATIDVETAAQIYAVRLPLERLLAEMAAERMTPDQLIVLRAIPEQLEVGIANRSPAEIVSVKRRFYDVLFRFAGNAELETVLRRLIGRLGLIWPAMIVESGEADASVSELGDVIAALAARSGSRAGSAMAYHIENAGRLTRNHLLTQEDRAP